MAMYHGFGRIKREYKTLKPKKSMCSGCYCDFYNHRENFDGKGCWNFEDAKVCLKEAYPNIYSKKTETYKSLSCYRGVNK